MSNDHESADPPGPSVDEWRRDHVLVVRRAGHCDFGVRPTFTRDLLSPGGTRMRVETPAAGAIMTGARHAETQRVRTPARGTA